MILTCGNCSKRYLISDTDINPEGRYVRCIACNHRWLQKPDDFSKNSSVTSDTNDNIDKATTTAGMAAAAAVGIGASQVNSLEKNHSVDSDYSSRENTQNSHEGTDIKPPVTEKTDYTKNGDSSGINGNKSEPREFNAPHNVQNSKITNNNTQGDFNNNSDFTSNNNVGEKPSANSASTQGVNSKYGAQEIGHSPERTSQNFQNQNQNQNQPTNMPTTDKKGLFTSEGHGPGNYTQQRQQTSEQEHHPQKASVQMPEHIQSSSFSFGKIFGIMLAGLLAFLGYFLYKDRNDISANSPSMKSFYNTVGIKTTPSNNIPDGIRVTNIKPEYTKKDGNKLVMVNGIIKNQSSEPFEIEDLVVDMMGSCADAPLMTRAGNMFSSNKSKKCVVDSWQHTMPKRTLAPGEEVVFKTSAHPIAKGAKSLRVHF